MRKLGEPFKKLDDIMEKICEVCGNELGGHDVYDSTTQSDHNNFAVTITVNTRCAGRK